jgi:hypothetical protein
MKVARLTLAIQAVLAASPLLVTPQIAAAQDVDLGNLGDRIFRIDWIGGDEQFAAGVNR